MWRFMLTAYSRCDYLCNMNDPTRRPRSKATIRAAQHARKLKSPSKQRLGRIADTYGIHVATLYRALAENKG